VLAVNMPNVAGVRNDPWQKYLTTVDRIEQSTGYDILSLLQTSFQDALEAGDRSPTADFAVAGTPREGSSIGFDASASTDPDLGRTDLGRTESLTYAWQFGDGGTATGRTASHTFADDGSYTATLTVSDAFGWQKTTSHTVAISNVAPSVSLSATTPLSILSGDAVSVAGSFTDPGSDAPWRSVLDWGNGTSTSATHSQSGASITGTKSYLAAGTYTIGLAVTDNDGASGARSLSVDVSRRPVSGTATPSSILLTDLDGDIKITLYSDRRTNVTLLDLASVRIGSVAAGAKKVKLKADVSGTASITLRFARQALVDAGVLTSSTTQLDVIGDLTTGMQIVSQVAFTAR
jgi:chitodextrinase